MTDFQAQFVRAARSDVTLTATLPPAELAALAATAHDVGKAPFELATEARDADGTVVMHCRASYQLRPLSGESKNG